MTHPFRRLAWTAATLTYVLIVLGAVVRITGSGMGCGDDWPLCNERLIPPLDDLGTLIEWGHRLAAGLVSLCVAAVAGYAWWLRRPHQPPPTSTILDRPGMSAYTALGLLLLQVLLGGITVRTGLTPLIVILHLVTALALLATLLMTATGARLPLGAGPETIALALGFVTVVLGGLTANLGAASACLGFPLCNGQLVPDGTYLQQLHWVHRLLAYGLTGYVTWWAFSTRAPGPRTILGLVLLQVAVAAAMVLLGLPAVLQASHVAVGTAMWAGLVIVAMRSGPPWPRPTSQT